MADTTIFARLKEDHDRHRELLAKIDQTSAANEEREQLFETFRIEVTAHAAAEEETLYATMLANPDLRHDAQHSVAEHKEIEDFLEEIEEIDRSAGTWMPKFREMKQRYLHHIDEEEEEMFPAAAEGLSDDKVEELAVRFEQRKPEEIERAEDGIDADDDRD